MSRNRISVLAMLAVGACAGAEEPPAPAIAVANEMERLARTYDLWPGFEPLAIPLAVYDGRRTYLFGHPSPPEGFVPLEGEGSPVHVFEGRHPAVTANSSADLGGITTATLMMDAAADPGDPTGLAAVALHEAFHVHQRERHPDWRANEADLFVYPVDDPRLLALRRLETEALRRALAATDSAESACWALQAIEHRRRRFAGMDSGFAEYERGTELNEGLAQYIELKAKDAERPELPSGGFGATRVRARGYATGAAFALLLDRFRPDWPVAFKEEERPELWTALEASLTERDRRRSDCVFTEAHIADVERTADEDVDALAAQRTERRAAFDARPGWRVVVEVANGDRLWARGFDPLNVDRVDGGLLHFRFLRLGNDAAELEAIDSPDADIEALTEGFGPHPLFNGVRRVVIAVPVEPEVTAGGEHVDVRAPGFTGRFTGAVTDRGANELVVRLKPIG